MRLEYQRPVLGFCPWFENITGRPTRVAPGREDPCLFLCMFMFGIAAHTVEGSRRCCFACLRCRACSVLATGAVLRRCACMLSFARMEPFFLYAKWHKHTWSVLMFPLVDRHASSVVETQKLRGPEVPKRQRAYITSKMRKNVPKI